MIREHCAAAFRGPYCVGLAVGASWICKGSFDLLHDFVPEPRPLPLVVGMTALFMAWLLLSVSCILSSLKSLWRFVRAAVQAIGSIDFPQWLNSVDFRQLLFSSVPTFVGDACKVAHLHSSVDIPIGIAVLAVALELNRSARTTPAPRMGVDARSVD